MQEQKCGGKVSGELMRFHTSVLFHVISLLLYLGASKFGTSPERQHLACCIRCWFSTDHGLFQFQWCKTPIYLVRMGTLDEYLCGYHFVQVVPIPIFRALIFLLEMRMEL